MQVDAALDATNVDRVASYVRKCTRPEHVHVVQGIIISLKDKFYENADALIGVTKNHEGNASAVYTFDLTRFNNMPEGL
jgi:structural maintenance of chromosome 1